MNTNRSSYSCLLPLSEQDAKRGVCHTARTKEKNGANLGEYSLSAMTATVFLSTAEEAEQKTLAAARLRTLRERNSWLLYRRGGRGTRRDRECKTRMALTRPLSPSNRQNARGGGRANRVGKIASK